MFRLALGVAQLSFQWAHRGFFFLQCSSIYCWGCVKLYVYPLHLRGVRLNFWQVPFDFAERISLSCIGLVGSVFNVAVVTMLILMWIAISLSRTACRISWPYKRLAYLIQKYASFWVIDGQWSIMKVMVSIILTF